jgi:hypothetical protein
VNPFLDTPGELLEAEPRGPPKVIQPQSQGVVITGIIVQGRPCDHFLPVSSIYPKLKNVTMHVLRHTAAMRLPRAGVETSVIALWLGHEQVDTTQTYLPADMEIKERALATTAPVNAMPGRFRPSDKLLPLLENL